mmetsp:Transcript_25240/g.42580  ORF Transcript_25240/g.42580 Transcript_25240/m.42580 type:complete len:284 (+) Transcript_25240:149-1000(+)
MYKAQKLPLQGPQRFIQMLILHTSRCFAFKTIDIILLDSLVTNFANASSFVQSSESLHIDRDHSIIHCVQHGFPLRISRSKFGCNCKFLSLKITLFFLNCTCSVFLHFFAIFVDHMFNKSIACLFINANHVNLFGVLPLCFQSALNIEISFFKICDLTANLLNVIVSFQIASMKSPKPFSSCLQDAYELHSLEVLASILSVHIVLHASVPVFFSAKGLKILFAVFLNPILIGDLNCPVQNDVYLISGFFAFHDIRGGEFQIPKRVFLRLHGHPRQRHCPVFLS